ncbi:SDR family oxidoreductase [Kutzneria sp. NPDC052558]|uniref:SDR family oxidoreductase n=1 Tax=Kutzneria sp. NPDC052558 TaxID=3364121 RepID=UPI0037C8B1AD
MRREIVVIIGTGGMGLAIARRLGSGKTLLLGDANPETLDRAAQALRGEGHSVHVRAVDVSTPESVAALADAAAELGPVTAIAHTAALSPAQAPVDVILRVDLVGTALVLDEFARVVAPGGAAVVVASMAGHLLPPLPKEHERALAITPTSELLALEFLGPDRIDHPAAAYGIAKRGNMLRVQHAAVRWGARRARVNSISPGIVFTAMSHEELAGEQGDVMRRMIDDSAAGRAGTPDDIADAAAFLLGPHAGFITGADLLVDGGVVASVRSRKAAKSMGRMR